MSCCCGIRNLRKQVRESLADVVRELRMLRFVLSRPGGLRLSVKREENDMLKFVVTLPPSATADVVARELVVTTAGDEPVVLNPALADLESVELSGNDNDAVHAELVDIDDAGNRSQASMLDAVLVDTIPPAQPGTLGLRVTGEE